MTAAHMTFLRLVIEAAAAAARAAASAMTGFGEYANMARTFGNDGGVNE